MSSGVNRRLPSISVNDKLISRFWKRVSKGDASECWPWMACTRNGYGCIKIDGRPHSAHRVSFVLTYGEPSESLVIAHKCDNKVCCNPSHLEAVTVAKNNADAHARLKRFDVIGSDRHNSVMTESDVHFICKNRVEFGFGWKRLARITGLSVHAVKEVIRGNNWKHISRSYGISK